jgi:hypothetical protein
MVGRSKSIPKANLILIQNFMFLQESIEAKNFPKQLLIHIPL